MSVDAQIEGYIAGQPGPRPRTCGRCTGLRSSRKSSGL